MVGHVGRIRKGGKDGMERMWEDEGMKGGDNEKDGWEDVVEGMERMRGTGRRIGRTGRGGEGKEERIILGKCLLLDIKELNY